MPGTGSWLRGDGDGQRKGGSVQQQKHQELLQIDPAERPAAVQLFGSEPDIMAEIAARLEEGPYDYIDVNMGCPVPKIVNNGEDPR